MESLKLFHPHNTQITFCRAYICQIKYLQYFGKFQAESVQVAKKIRSIFFFCIQLFPINSIKLLQGSAIKCEATDAVSTKSITWYVIISRFF